MTEIGLQVTMTATAEVRDAEGNLLNTFPVEYTRPLTEEEMAEIHRLEALES